LKSVYLNIGTLPVPAHLLTFARLPGLGTSNSSRSQMPSARGS